MAGEGLEPRWNEARQVEETNARVDAFLKAVQLLEAQHGLTISHQDGHGAFIVEGWSKVNSDWLWGANIGEGVEEDE